MIPKKIHFCWLGGKEYPKLVQQCLESWSTVLPDYEIIRWDENRFDVKAVLWVREAIKRKKYAFAADYIRHYALYYEGGIYLDTDVEAIKSFDDLLDANMFAALETEDTVLAENTAKGYISETGDVLTDDLIPNMGLGVQSGMFGCVAGHPFSRRCLDWYDNHHFILKDGTLYDKIIAPDIMAYHARPAGLKYKDVAQELNEGIQIHPSTTIAAYPAKACPENYAIHHCLGSWRPEKPGKKKKWYSRWWKSSMRSLGLHK